MIEVRSLIGAMYLITSYSRGSYEYREVDRRKQEIYYKIRKSNKDKDEKKKLQENLKICRANLEYQTPVDESNN